MVLRSSLKRAIATGSIAASALALGLGGTAEATGPGYTAAAHVTPQYKVIKVLSAGQQLHNPTLIASPNQQYLAGMQPDGNFVVFHKVNGGVKPIWATHTDHHNGSYLRFWKDSGALAVYSKTNKLLWKAGEKGGKAKYLIVQDDGNLVLYTAAKKAVWSSKFH